MQNQLFLSTRRAAEIAGVARHVLLNHYRRAGQWHGVKPGKLASGHLTWPAVRFYQALGKLPPDARQGPAESLRDTLTARTCADPFQAQQVCAALLSQDPTGTTHRERLSALLTDAQHLADHAEAFGRRAGQVLAHENLFGNDDFRRLNIAAEDIEQACAKAITPLKWRPPPPPTLHGMFELSQRRIVGGQP